MAGSAVRDPGATKQEKRANAKQESILEWARGFCFQRFNDESHQAWLGDAPAWIEALPFRAVFILLWNLLASSPLWAMYLTMSITIMSMVAMVLQIVAMGMVNSDPRNTAGYWVFYFGSFGSPAFEAAWLLTQFLLGLAAEHVITTVQPARAREEAELAARSSASPAARKGDVRNPLDAPSGTALFPQMDLKNIRARDSVSSRGSAASKASSRRSDRGRSPTASSAHRLVTTAVGVNTVKLSPKQSDAFVQLLEHKDAITAGFSVLLWLAWAVHISGLYVYSHACAEFQQERQGIISGATAFNCLDLKDTGDLLRNPVDRFAMVGQLLHALASCGMVLTLWAMPPQAPFTPHGMLKWGVLGFAVVTFAQLAFAVLGSDESTSNKTWGETLAMFSIRVLSCVFAVLAVVPLPPLSYLLSEEDDADAEQSNNMKNLRLTAGRTRQDEYRQRVADAAMARLQEKQLNTCMHCSRWSMAVGLFTYMLVFVAFALLPLTGGTFALSWGRLGFLPGTGLSVYEVLLPLAVASPLMLTIARSMFMALLSIHELCHRVHVSRAVYGWLTKYCLGCCCEVLCFACCCCYACCREEQERVIRGKFNCPDCREAWDNSPFLQCFGCVSAAPGVSHDEEATPILGGQPAPRTSASPGHVADAKAVHRKSQSLPTSADADQVRPSVNVAAGISADSGSPVFVTEEEPTRVLKLLREGLSESDVLAGVTEKPKRGHLVRNNLQGLASKARVGGAAAGAAASASEREAAMQEAANGLSNLSVVDLLNDDQYHSLLKALLPEGAKVYKGAPTAEEQLPERALPRRRSKAPSTPEAVASQDTRSIVAADRSQIAWLPYSVWGFAVGSVLIPPLLRAMRHDRFFYYDRPGISDTSHTFAQTRLTLTLLLLIAYGLRGAYSLRRTLRLLHRIRRVVEAAVSLDIHATEWNFPYDMHGAAEWSARLLFASRFVSAQFTGPTAGFLSAWLLGTLLSALTLAILVLAGADWPHALEAPEFYTFGAVLFVYVAVGLFMLWQLLQTDDVIFGSIRDVSVLSARGGVVNTYRSLMAEYANSAVAVRGGGNAKRLPHAGSPSSREDLSSASFAQLLAITWQQRYPGIQILLVEGLEASRVTLSKASFRALVVGAAVSGVSTLGRLLYARLTKSS